MKKKCLAACLSLLMMSVVATCFGNPAGSLPDYSANDEDKLLLFLIDFDDFMCPACLDSFLSFCHSLPFPLLEENTWGILAGQKPGRNPNSKISLGIIQKKLRGFMRANRIRFPIMIDSDFLFKELMRDGTALIIFNRGGKSMSKYTFPLSRKQREEIFQALSLTYSGYDILNLI